MLSNPTGGAVLDDERSLAVLTILDSGGGGTAGSHGVLKFDEVSFEVIEGQTQAVIRVERSNGESGAVAVDFSTSDGSATAGDDYQSVSGTLSWGSGDGSTKTFNVPVFADDLSEGNESVNLHLSNATGGATIDSTRGNSILNILDDDGSTTPCEPGDDSGCTQGSRFAIEATYRTATGFIGRGQMVHAVARPRSASGSSAPTTSRCWSRPSTPAASRPSPPTGSSTRRPPTSTSPCA